MEVFSSVRRFIAEVADLLINYILPAFISARRSMVNFGNGQFRSSVWDPFLIISQIMAVQSIFYTSLGFWTFCLDWLTGTTKSLDQIFKYQVC